MTRDVLAELAAGTMTVEEVESLYDKVMDSAESSEIAELLGMSREEWTAFGHGVGFEELVQWRISGWPSCCPRCGKPIVPSSFGWLAQPAELGLHFITHIKCL